eukprot:2170221-Pyramimonas_sp.AAC.1
MFVAPAQTSPQGIAHGQSRMDVPVRGEHSHAHRCGYQAPENSARSGPGRFQNFTLARPAIAPQATRARPPQVQSPRT